MVRIEAIYVRGASKGIVAECDRSFKKISRTVGIGIGILSTDQVNNGREGENDALRGHF